MNFFGHAAVAGWFDADPHFALGAMVPDFAGMLGTRPPKATPGAVARGIAFHHRTDAAFHGSERFLRLERSARAQLAALGLPRGSYLAVAHIGVEMLLDLVLAESAETRRLYERALAAGLQPSTAGMLVWTPPAHGDDFARLLLMLEQRAAAPPLDEPGALAPRIERALARRPLLALPPGGRREVERWLEEAAGAVRLAAPALLEELAAELG